MMSIEYNRTLVTLSPVDIMNTLLAHTLLDYSPEHVTH